MKTRTLHSLCLFLFVLCCFNSLAAKEKINSHLMDTDLELSITSSSSTLTAWTNITFEVIVENTSSVDATSVTVDFSYPSSSFAYVNQYESNGTYYSWTGEWNIGTVEANSKDTLQVTLYTLDDVTPVTLQSEVKTASPNDSDSTPGNIGGSASEDDEGEVSFGTPPSGTDIEVSLNVAQTTFQINQSITFTVVVENKGPGDASGLELTYPVPSGFTYSSQNVILGTYNDVTGIWNLGSLSSGTLATLDVTMIANQDVNPVTHFVQLTALTESDPDSAPNNNTGTTPVEDDEAAQTVSPSTAQNADIAVTILDPVPNEISIYTNNNFKVEVRNNGPLTANNVVVNFPFTSGVWAYTSSGTNYNTSTMSWTISSLASGAVDTLDVMLFSLQSTNSVQMTSQVVSLDETDPNTSNDSDTLTIYQQGQTPFSISGTVTAPTNSQNDNGSISTTVAGGTSPYSYTWSNSETTANISGLTPGTYSVTVTDANSQTATNSFTVPSGQSSLSVTGVVSAPTNSQNDSGSIDITVTGGTSPYTYAWDSGATSEDISGLIPGTYSVTVTDANSQTQAKSFVVPSVGGVSDVVWKETPFDVVQTGNEYKKFNGNLYYYLRGCNEVASGNEGYIEFELLENTILTSKEFHIGLIDTSRTLSAQDSPTGSNDPNHQFSIQDGTVRIYEHENQRLILNGGTVIGTKYKINKDQNGVVTYFKNDSLLYTSTVPDSNFVFQPIMILFRPGTDKKINVDIDASFGCEELIPRVLKEDILYSNNGTIDLIPEGGYPNYSYIWSDGNLSEDIVNITTPGNYKVTITDQTAQTKNLEIDIFDLVHNTWTEGTNGDLTITGNNYSKTVSGDIKLGSCNEVLKTDTALFEVDILSDFAYPDQFAFGFNEKGSNVFYDKFYGIMLNSAGYVVHNGSGTIPVLSHINYIGSGVNFSVKLKDGDMIFYKNDREFERIENIVFVQDTLVANAYFKQTKPTGIDLDFKISKDCVDSNGMNDIVWMDAPTGTTMGDKYTTNTEALNLEGCNILDKDSSGYIELIIKKALTGTEKIVFGMAAPHQSIVLDDSYQGFAQDYYSIEINASNSMVGDTFKIDKSFGTYIAFTKNEEEFAATENLPTPMALSPYIFICSDAGQSEFDLDINATFGCELNYVLKKEEALGDSLGMLNVIPYGNGSLEILWASGDSISLRDSLSSGDYAFSVINTETNDTISSAVPVYESHDLEWETVPDTVIVSGDSISNQSSLDQLLWGCGNLMTGDTGFIRIKIMESSENSKFSIGFAPPETPVTNPDDQFIYGLKFDGDYGMGVTGDNLLMESPLCMSQDKGVTYKIERNSAGEIVFYKNERPFYSYTTTMDTILKPVVFLEGATDDFEVAIQTSFGCSQGNNNYVKIEKKLDGSYAKSERGELKIKYIESYAQRDAALSFVNYSILDWSRQEVKSGQLTNSYGANFKTIDTRGLNQNEFYTLRIAGPNKGEVYYLRFKRADGTPN